jgi:hypothetical protein
MSSKPFCFLMLLIIAVLSCSHLSEPIPSTSTDAAALHKAVEYCTKCCDAALPKGYYVQELTVSYGPQPTSCEDRIQALESEIFDLESELDELRDKCYQ